MSRTTPVRPDRSRTTRMRPGRAPRTPDRRRSALGAVLLLGPLLGALLVATATQPPEPVTRPLPAATPHAAATPAAFRVTQRPEPTLVPVRFIALEPEALRLEPTMMDANAVLGTVVSVPTTRDQLARAAASLVLTGRPDDRSLMTAAPAGLHVLSVTLEDGVAIVDVTGPLAEVRGTAVREELLAQQLAHTLADVVGADAVRLRIDGRPVARLWGHLDWSEGIAPAPDAVVLVD